MAKIELGEIGAVLSPGDDGFVASAAELEDLGYSTIWLTGGPMESLDQIADVVRATRAVRVASGIISVDRFTSDDVGALYTELDSTFPGRFVVGLGGAHGPDPMGTLNTYLDRLDEAVPPSARVMAALGPKMFELARDRAAGALPVLITPAYTAQARSILGGDVTLAVEQLVVVDGDAERARQAARGPLGFLGTLPAYRANFRRMGFADDDIATQSDRLVDELVYWGAVDSIAERIVEHHAAGADHVAVSVVGTSAATPLDAWRQLAAALIET
jgi:probable F420-dependent oxidoreductase